MRIFKGKQQKNKVSPSYHGYYRKFLFCVSLGFKNLCLARFLFYFGAVGIVQLISWTVVIPFGCVPFECPAYI